MINERKLFYNMLKAGIQQVAEIKTSGNIDPETMEKLFMIFLSEDEDNLNLQNAATKVLSEQIAIPEGKPAKFKLAIKISKENVCGLAKMFEHDPKEVEDIFNTLPLMKIETGISLSVTRKSDQLEIPINFTLIDRDDKSKSSKFSLKIGLSVLNFSFIKNILLSHINSDSFMKSGRVLYGEDPFAMNKMRIENLLMARSEETREQLRINTYKEHGITEWTSFEEKVESLKKGIEDFFSAEDIFEKIKNLKTTIEIENQEDNLIFNFNYTHTPKK